MDCYVELDGVLICGHLKILLSKLKLVDEESAQKIIQEEYSRRSQIGLNRQLIRELCALKERGRRLILWTERLEKQRKATQEQLGPLWYLFEEHLFAPTERPAQLIQSGWFCCLDGSCLFNPVLKKSKY